MNSLQTVAEMMEIAATTAPKAVGKNFVVTKILDGDECKRLAGEMANYGEESGRKNFDRDGANVRDSGAVLLIGMKDAAPTGINCGACGFPTCLKINTGDRSSEFLGPQCAIRILDMGIALGSAAKTAQLFNVDNRIMYRIGAVARKLGMIDADFVMGIPMSVTGKSIFFDR
ncbi:MAG: ferredoxin domain-containing protein [Spirochaetota bacterium]